MRIVWKHSLVLGLLGVLFNFNVSADTGFDFSVKAVTENVYSIIAPSVGRPTPENRGWNSNSHFIVTDDGVLVFDTGSSEIIGNELLRAIGTVTEQPVRWVVNSHSHADHWLGNAAFANKGAQVISTRPSMLAMKEDGQGVVEAFSKMTDGATGHTKATYPTSFLLQSQKQTFGGVEIEFIFSDNGHSPGDVLMWLPKQKIIFGGDVLSSDWMPIMTPRGNVNNLIDTLEAVIGLNPTFVLPGHGQISNVQSVKRDAKFLSAVRNLLKSTNNNGKL